MVFVIKMECPLIQHYLWLDAIDLVLILMMMRIAVVVVVDCYHYDHLLAVAREQQLVVDFANIPMHHSYDASLLLVVDYDDDD